MNIQKVGISTQANNYHNNRKIPFGNKEEIIELASKGGIVGLDIGAKVKEVPDALNEILGNVFRFSSPTKVDSVPDGLRDVLQLSHREMPRWLAREHLDPTMLNKPD